MSEAISNVIQENIDMRDNIADAYSAIFKQDATVTIPTSNEGALNDENLPQTIRNIKTFSGDLNSEDGKKIFAERGILGETNHNLNQIKYNNGIYFLKANEEYENLPNDLIDNNKLKKDSILKVILRKEDSQVFWAFQEIFTIDGQEKFIRYYINNNWIVWTVKEDFTTELMNKLNNIEPEANKTIVDSELSNTSKNPVQNKAVQGALDNKVDKEDGKSLISNIDQAKLDGIEVGANNTIIDNSLSQSGQAADSGRVGEALSAKEDSSNKATSLDIPSDETYPTTKAVSDALNTKVDKENGKNLSTNDFTNEDRGQLNKTIKQYNIANKRIAVNDYSLPAAPHSLLYSNILLLPQYNKIIIYPNKDINDAVVQYCILKNKNYSEDNFIVKNIIRDLSVPITIEYEEYKEQNDSLYLIAMIKYNDTTKVFDLEEDKDSLTFMFNGTINDALNTKVDKEDGKSLISNIDQAKLDGIEAEANNTIIDNSLSQNGQAADAKTVGDILNTKASKEQMGIVLNKWRQGNLDKTNVLTRIISSDFIPIDDDCKKIIIIPQERNTEKPIQYIIYEYEEGSSTPINNSPSASSLINKYQIYEFSSDAKTFKILIFYSNTDNITPEEGDNIINLFWYNKPLPYFLIDLPIGYEKNIIEIPGIKGTEKPEEIKKIEEDIYLDKYFIKTDGTLQAQINSAYFYRITKAIELNDGDILEIQHSIGNDMVGLAETDVKYSYYKPIPISNFGKTINTYIADHHMYICGVGRRDVEIKITVTRKKSFTFEQKIELNHKGVIGPTGGVLMDYIVSVNYKDFHFSDPIKVEKGDIITFSAPTVDTYYMMVKFFDRINTYLANTLGHGKGVCRATSTGYETQKWIADETCYIVFQAPKDHITVNRPLLCTITRSYDSVLATQINNKYTEENFAITKHNYVDQYDFVPRLNKKRTNSILTYSGDTKHDSIANSITEGTNRRSGYIVNAVAYPNGEIIACRSNGDVVKIDNNGNETLLRKIPNTTDWRGVFMDSNLNVYVSPHSSRSTPSLSVENRGLYRLPYKGTELQKVISLYRDDSIPLWKKKTYYENGDIIFRNYYSEIYKFNASEDFDPNSTSNSTLEEQINNGYWTKLEDKWAKNKHYSVGDIIIYNKCYFYCIQEHTSQEKFNFEYWNAATEYTKNDDTIWTMCEDDVGNLYAGVYSHSIRKNPAIYKSTDNGNTWFYQHNFIMNETLTLDNYGSSSICHVHCVNFNPYNNCLYAAVGEVNTIVKSSDYGETWKDLQVPCYYGQPTYVMGVKDGLVIGSDGHYSCGVSKLMTDDKTLKLCGRTAPGFVFNIRRSDLTGWLYMWTRIDNYVQNQKDAPPPDAINNPAVLQEWLDEPDKDKVDPVSRGLWKDYHIWAEKYYPEDAIRPQNVVIMVSKDDGDTWEVIRMEKVSDNFAPICGFITVGYFRDGECLAGFLKPKLTSTTDNDMDFVNPIIISEGKKKRVFNGYDLTGEIFIKTNSDYIIPYEE